MEPEEQDLRFVLIDIDVVTDFDRPKFSPFVRLTDAEPGTDDIRMRVGHGNDLLTQFSIVVKGRVFGWEGFCFHDSLCIKAERLDLLEFLRRRAHDYVVRPDALNRGTSASHRRSLF